MTDSRPRPTPALTPAPSSLVAGAGAVLLLAAVTHHAREFLALSGAVGPLVAVVFDGTPAVGLVFAGYWLSRTDLETPDRWTVARWCLAGAALFVAAIGATFLVRVIEGRPVAEPAFPLLVAAETGALAGVVAGYYNARARTEVQRARRATDALAFVNELVRHDLRNDLTVIHAQAQLLEERGEDGDTTPGDPGVVVEKADEAAERIEVSRAIADTLTGDADLEPVDLVPLLEDVAGRTEEAFGTPVRTELPDRARVAANAGVRSIVDNLLENAAEHNDADDPRIAVEVRTAPDTVRLLVRDNGPGIPDQLRAALSGRRDGDVGESGERGGLSLVATLGGAYGGELRIRDNEPRGSTVVVDLPRADGAVE